MLGHGDTTDCVGSIFRVPPYTAYPVPIAAIPLGIARHALDVFYKMAATKIPRSGTGRRIDPVCACRIHVWQNHLALLLSVGSFLMLTGGLLAQHPVETGPADP